MAPRKRNTVFLFFCSRVFPRFFRLKFPGTSASGGKTEDERHNSGSISIRRIRLSFGRRGDEEAEEEGEGGRVRVERANGVPRRDDSLCIRSVWQTLDQALLKLKWDASARDERTSGRHLSSSPRPFFVFFISVGSNSAGDFFVIFIRRLVFSADVQLLPLPHRCLWYTLVR